MAPDDVSSSEPVFDCDNHYYEAEDAFSRHLDPAWADRTVRWVEIDGRRYHAVGGRVARVVSNPTFDPVAMPGALHEYLRGNPHGHTPAELLGAREPIPAAYRDPEARLEVMDEQGVDQVWLFPTLGVLYEELLKHDPPAVTVAFNSFNRWLLDDWGFDFKSRIFAAPYISLNDIDNAVGQLEFALDHGARTVVMRAAAPTTATGQVPPASRAFDPFWARVNEAGITVVVHGADTGFSFNGYARQEFSFAFGGEGVATQLGLQVLAVERSISDFLMSMILERLFERFDNLRIASVENGSAFLPGLLPRLKSFSDKMPGHFAESPVETFRRHVWINPFWEEELDVAVDLMGADHVIFGSDWPHVEGLAAPLDYLAELEGFDGTAKRRILHDNTAALTELRPS